MVSFVNVATSDIMMNILKLKIGYPMKRTVVFSRQLIVVHLSLLLFGLAGCSSSKPASARFASVEIHNQPPDKIAAAATQVFRENGYRGGASGTRKMVFEKEGTYANNLAYNGVVGATYGAQTLVRVRAELVDLGEGSQRLQCQTFMVRNAGDSFFEEESRLTNIRSGPYQKLLNDVATRLK